LEKEVIYVPLTIKAMVDPWDEPEATPFVDVAALLSTPLAALLLAPLVARSPLVVPFL
jgi:hypothetical protein